MNNKKPWIHAICIRNDFHYERVINIGEVYPVISETNNYICVKTNFGIQKIRKLYFRRVTTLPGKEIAIIY